MVVEQTVENEDWQEEFLIDKPVNDSKYFSDPVPEGGLVYVTSFKFLNDGTKKQNKFGKQVVEFFIEHDGKEKILSVNITNFDILKAIAKAKPVVNKTVDWQRSGSTQKDTRRAIRFKQ